MANPVRPVARRSTVQRAVGRSEHYLAGLRAGRVAGGGWEERQALCAPDMIAEEERHLHRLREVLAAC